MMLEVFNRKEQALLKLLMASFNPQEFLDFVMKVIAVDAAHITFKEGEGNVKEIATLIKEDDNCVYSLLITRAKMEEGDLKKYVDSLLRK